MRGRAVARWPMWWGIFLAFCVALGPVRAAGLSDPFGTADELPAPSAERVAVAGLPPCSYGGPRGPLTLLDTVRRALCYNPQTRAAWANVEAHAAAVGLRQSAYLPTVNVSAGISQVNELDKYSGMPELNSSLHTLSNEESASLNWVLYDFGLRSANLHYERALLDAASASQDDAIQSVYLDAVQAYFTAEAAQATQGADTEAEQAAWQSFQAADAKAAAGVGSEADRLQARTAYAQATLNRIRSREDMRDAVGALAVVMGMRPGADLTLPKATGSIPDGTPPGASVDQLIERAMHAHPKISAVRARLDAARDGISAARAGGRPSIAFTAIGDRSDTPINRVSTKQEIDTSSIGLQLTIPLFEGFGRTYRVRQAEAEAEGREAELFAAQQQVAQDVWRSYMAVRRSSEDNQAVRLLLDSASQSFDLALGRYQSGVGSILELLKAQTDLASARQQGVLARTRWRVARLQLAASLGQIDFTSLQDPDAGASTVVAPAGPGEGPAGASPAPASHPVAASANTPVIASISPNPVSGVYSPQVLTLIGSHFLEGARVTFRDKTHGLSYVGRAPITRAETRLQVKAKVGCNAQWTAEVVNPDAHSSGEVPFRVTGRCPEK